MAHADCYLTRRANHTAMLTGLKPEAWFVLGTERLEAWPVPGDPLFVDSLCLQWTHKTLGRRLRRLETVRVRVSFKEMSDACD